MDYDTEYSLNFGSDPQLPVACMEQCSSAFLDSLQDPAVRHKAADNEPLDCSAKVTFGNIAVRRAVGISRNVTVTEHCTDHRQLSGETTHRSRCQNPTEQLQVITQAC